MPMLSPIIIQRGRLDRSRAEDELAHSTTTQLSPTNTSSICNSC